MGQVCGKRSRGQVAPHPGPDVDRPGPEGKNVEKGGGRTSKVAPLTGQVEDPARQAEGKKAEKGEPDGGQTPKAGPLPGQAAGPAPKPEGKKAEKGEQDGGRTPKAALLPGQAVDRACPPEGKKVEKGEQDGGQTPKAAPLPGQAADPAPKPEGKKAEKGDQDGGRTPKGAPLPGQAVDPARQPEGKKAERGEQDGGRTSKAVPLPCQAAGPAPKPEIKKAEKGEQDGGRTSKAAPLPGQAADPASKPEGKKAEKGEQDGGRTPKVESLPSQVAGTAPKPEGKKADTRDGGQTPKVSPLRGQDADPGLCDKVVVDQQLLPEAAPAGSAQEVAEKLARLGFSLRQLLRFYLSFSSTGDINERTTTAEVVKNIVIPQTAGSRLSYMESDFMKSLGGPQEATILVSHAWKNRFVNTVTSIVAHACSLSKDSGLLQKGDFQKILQTYPLEVLDKTYWLCIFAVRQHLAICGDCWECSGSAKWKQNPAKYLAADPCLLCRTQKRNPCECGSAKLTAGDPEYEIDKFDLVVERMETLLVSLDADLHTVRRVWVCAEVGTAASHIPVQFVLAEPIKTALLEQRLKKKRRLLPPVAQCESSSEEDKKCILKAIERDPGTETFDELVRILLEVNFGFLEQLSTVPPLVEDALGRLTYLDIDCTWLSSMADTKELFGSGDAFHKLQLRVLIVNLSGCSKLSNVDSLACALRTQTKLEKLALYLQDSGLDDACAGVVAAAMPSRLDCLTLKLWCTRIGDRGVMAIMQKVPQDMRGTLSVGLGKKDRLVLSAAALSAVADALPPTLEGDLELALLNIPVDRTSVDRLAAKLPPKLKGSLLLQVPSINEEGGRALVSNMPTGVRKLQLQLRREPPGTYADVRSRAKKRCPTADVEVVNDE